MRFTLYCKDAAGKSNDVTKLYYDNCTGLLHDTDGKSFGTGEALQYKQPKPFKANQAKAPIRKSNAPRILKVQMGLSCNYECNYCLQRFVPHSDEKSKSLVPEFIEKVKKHLVGEPENIQLWGGEPLVYIKTMMPLVAELKKLYPNAVYSIITNGALLSDPIVDWILENDIRVSMSHDGPGQAVRGDDPLKHILAGKAIKRLYKAMKERGTPMSINPMIHADNPDRAAVQEWLKEAFDDPDIILGEGAVIEVYDEGARENSLKTLDDQLKIRNLTHKQLINHEIDNYGVVQSRMNDWIQTMQGGRDIDTLGMKCGMDNHATLTVDLSGNVVTCQNVSSVATAPNGEPHLGGTIENIPAVEIKTSVHFQNRDHCSGCPVVQSCKGGCMYLVDDLFYDSCNNTYSDHIPFFASAVELLTGLTPFYIEDEAGKLPKERKDIWGGLDA